MDESLIISLSLVGGVIGTGMLVTLTRYIYVTYKNYKTTVQQKKQIMDLQHSIESQVAEQQQQIEEIKSIIEQTQKITAEQMAEVNNQQISENKKLQQPLPIYNTSSYQTFFSKLENQQHLSRPLTTQKTNSPAESVHSAKINEPVEVKELEPTPANVQILKPSSAFKLVEDEESNKKFTQHSVDNISKLKYMHTTLTQQVNDLSEQSEQITQALVGVTQDQDTVINMQLTGKC
jgi:hypothetical protein